MFDLLPLRRRGAVPNVFSEMDEMLRKMWLGFPFHGVDEDLELTWSPHLDVGETETAIEVKADLPGMEKKDIEIALDGDLLIIRGERHEEKETKDKRYHAIERRSGSFYRALRLPVAVVEDKIEAVFKDGVLTLTLPKAEVEEKKVTKIEVK